MQIPGHIAVAIAQYRLLSYRHQSKGTLKPLLLASLFPDLVDKSIGYVFHLMPNGRHYSHNFFSLILLSFAVTLIWGKRAGHAWFVGYLGHLLADTGNNKQVPWFFPLKNYRFRPGRLAFEPSQLLRETIFLVLTLFVYRISS